MRERNAIAIHQKKEGEGLPMCRRPLEGCSLPLLFRKQ